MNRNRELHNSITNLPYKIGAVITGGGAGGITDLLKMGGMSSVLEELSIPYGLNSNEQFMRHVYLPSHCSKGAAILLAAAQADRLIRMGVENPMAVACTASLYSDGQREGRVNQAWICIATDEGVWVDDIQFSHAQSRKHQEKTLEYNLLHWILDPTTMPMFYAGSMEDFCHYYTPLQATATQPREFGPIVFCGSFNPWHKGHESILQLAHKRYPKRNNIVIELSAINADKGIITPNDIDERLQTISHQNFKDKDSYSVNIRTKIGTAATFIDKCDVYINPLFIVGSDTMIRIGDKQYYRNYDKSMRRLANNAQFFVILRGHTELEVKNNIPDYLYDKCVFAEHEYSHISSTQIRSNGGA